MDCSGSDTSSFTCGAGGNVALGLPGQKARAARGAVLPRAAREACLPPAIRVWVLARYAPCSTRAGDDEEEE